jgi:hypothetical protein
MKRGGMMLPIPNKRIEELKKELTMLKAQNEGLEENINELIEATTGLYAYLLFMETKLGYKMPDELADKMNAVQDILIKLEDPDAEYGIEISIEFNDPGVKQ